MSVSNEKLVLGAGIAFLLYNINAAHEAANRVPKNIYFNKEKYKRKMPKAYRGENEVYRFFTSTPLIYAELGTEYPKIWSENYRKKSEVEEPDPRGNLISQLFDGTVFGPTTKPEPRNPTEQRVRTKEDHAKSNRLFTGRTCGASGVCI